MATLSAIAEWPHLVKNIFLTQKKNSAGIFGIQFYIRGKPYHISVDDSTMFYNSSFLDYMPYYAWTSNDKKVTWVMVIEKAWAKVIGNYQKIAGGW